MGMPRVNLLLVAPEGVVQYVLESFLLDLRQPMTTWRPGERLTLPPAHLPGTLILHDVGNLSPAEQLELLGWLADVEPRRPGRQHVVNAADAASELRQRSWTRFTTG